MTTAGFVPVFNGTDTPYCRQMGHIEPGVGALYCGLVVGGEPGPGTCFINETQTRSVASFCHAIPRNVLSHSCCLPFSKTSRIASHWISGIFLYISILIDNTTKWNHTGIHSFYFLHIVNFQGKASAGKFTIEGFIEQIICSGFGLNWLIYRLLITIPWILLSFVLGN